MAEGYLMACAGSLLLYSVVVSRVARNMIAYSKVLSVDSTKGISKQRMDKKGIVG